jgi:hypothetical protein
LVDGRTTPSMAAFQPAVVAVCVGVGELALPPPDEHPARSTAPATPTLASATRLLVFFIWFPSSSLARTIGVAGIYCGHAVRGA